MKTKSKTVCIFCGARTGNSDIIVESTKLLSKTFAIDGYDLVYGGGQQGLMAIVVEQFLQEKRMIYGERPKNLIRNIEDYQNCTELISVDTLQERKSQMINMSDIFICLPGCIGTLDELLEVVVMNKMKYTNKPIGILNIEGFYNGWLIQIEKMIQFGFISKNILKCFYISKDPLELLKVKFSITSIPYLIFINKRYFIYQ
ncbi:TIGR00730 family Rossman fold protein [Croceibacter atlanticus]|uniref:LOG family protein n=1 Tax=Croceibacter atlanticus TaxID=313588 RepID=UPI002E152F2A|nr:TIGR00730 family Rossman fold protein [Croceibacter atlanticus]